MSGTTALTGRTAVRDGDADPDDTIDGADPRPTDPPSFAKPSEPPSDYQQLTPVERHHYAISGQIAKGGNGRVLEARDLRLGRDVAIKELLPKNRHAARRFEREARITARLQHPGIIHVYEAGVWPGGEPFYAMPRVPGRSLDKVVAERNTLDERLGLLPNVIAVADALAYAHNANVIHRDLKPANVLVGEFGETVVIDWGLAKDLGAATDPSAASDPFESMQLRLRATAEETVSGGIIGTPAYMPPEQARGEAVDQRADVYALGALLYKVLSGVAPYQGDSSKAVLELVKTTTPVPVHEREPDAPRDLVAIVAKAMARIADDRYDSAAELAQDLKRFETGQLVNAHHYTVGQLLWRWLRRHRLTVAIASIAVVAIIIGGTFSVRRILDEKHRAEVERSKAQAGRMVLLEEHGRTELLAGNSGAALAYLVGAAGDGRIGGARGFLIADATRPFEAELAHRDVGKGDVAIAVSPDGKLVASGGAGSIAITTSDGALVRSLGEHGVTRVVAFDRSSSRLVAAGDDGLARVWSIDGTLAAELEGHQGAILDAAFSPDGTTVVTASTDATVRIWELATKTSKTSTCHHGPVVSARFSPDGQHVVTASFDKTACVIDAHTGAIESPLKGHTDRVTTATWSDDGMYVVTASADGTARVWNAARGKPVVAPMYHHAGSIVEVALLTHDGHVVTAGSDLVVNVWALPSELPADGKTAAAKLARTLEAHTGSIISAALGYDDTLLVTGGYDGLAKIWDLASGQVIASLPHSGVVGAVALVGGRARLVTGSRDGTARVWDTTVAKLRPPLDSEIHAVAVAPDHTVAVATDDSQVRLVRNETTTPLRGHLGRVYALAFTPNGKRLISAGEDAEVIIWNVATASRIGTLGNHDATIGALAIDPDGDTVAMLVGDRVELWSLARRARLRVLQVSDSHIEAIAVSPAGGLVAGVGTDGSLVLWSTSGVLLARHRDRATPYTTLAFAPSGELLATAGMGVAHVWRVSAGTLGKMQFAAEGSAGVVRTIAVTHDGSRMITAGDDGRARIWDMAKGKLLGTRDRHDVPVNAIAVDGDTLWLAGKDGTLATWDIHIDTRTTAELARFIAAKHIEERLDDDDVVRRGGANR